MLLETIVPGGIAFFLGVGGVAVAGVRALGLLIDPLTAVVTWILLSTGLTIALRPLMLRFVRGDTSLAMTDEDAEAMGQTVTVLEPVGPDEPGRIQFRGSAWDARTPHGTLPEGAKAQILYRDNLTWVVEPADHADLDEELSKALESDLDEIEGGDSTDRSSGASGLGYDPSAQQVE